MKPIDIMKAINDLDDSYLVEREMYPKKSLNINIRSVMLIVTVLLFGIVAMLMALVTGI